MPPQTTPAHSSRFSFEHASVWALIATIILTAVVLIPSSSVPFLPTKVFVLALGSIITLALYILARLTRGNVIFPPLLLVGALWLPVLAYALSTMFSGANITNAVFGTALESDTLGFMLVVGFLGTLTALILRRGSQYQSFFKALAYALGFVVIVQFLILVVGQFAPKIISPTLSLVGSLEDLGALLGLGVVTALLTLRLMHVPARSRMVLMVGGVLALFLLALLNSPIVWVLVALVALGLFVEAVMKRSPQESMGDLEGSTILSESESDNGGTSHSLVAPLVVLIVSLFFLIGSTLGGALATLFHVNTLNVRPSWQSTLAVGSKVYSDSPVFGSGPGTFETSWVKYHDVSLNQTVFWNIDFSSGIGFVPTSFVTTGILGTLLWLAFFGLFLFFGIRAVLFRTFEDRTVRATAILSFVGTCYLFAIAVLTLPGAVLLALAFVFAGIFASTMRFASGGRQWGIAFGKSPRIGFVIVFKLTLLLLASIVAAYVFIERYIAQVDLLRATTALNAGNLEAAEAAANASLAFAPSAFAYQIQAQVAQVRLQQIAASTTLGAADAQQQFQAALSAGINAALTATRTAPNDYQSWVALGNLYATVVPLKVASAYENAKVAYEKAAVLSPSNPTIPYALAQLSIANKDNAGAKIYLKQAITLKQDYTAAIFLLSQLEVQDGNIKAALEAAEAAAYFTPNNPTVLFQLGLLRAANGNTEGAIQALAGAVSLNPQFANARYFLAAAYAKNGDFSNSLAQMEAIATLSSDNATAVEGTIEALKKGKSPFPANLLSSTSTPIAQ